MGSLCGIQAASGETIDEKLTAALRQPYFLELIGRLAY